MVHVLGDPALVARLRDVLRDATGSLGVRVTTGERWPVARSVHSVWVDGQMIRVKVASGKVKAEYEDVARAARRTGGSLREVAFRAEASWREVHGADGGLGPVPDRDASRTGRTGRDRSWWPNGRPRRAQDLRLKAVRTAGDRPTSATVG